MSYTKVDWKKWSDDANKLAILEDRTGTEELQHQGKLLVRDLIRLTPPMSEHALTENWGVQQESGKKAIRNDVARNWQAANSILTGLEATNPNAAKSAKNYIRAGNLEAFKSLLSKLGWRDVEFAKARVTEADHDARRSPKTGRATGSIRALVLSGTSIKQLVRIKESHVGKAKAGWMKAVRGLGVTGIPGWIAGHATPGIYEPILSVMRKSIVIGNLIRYARNLVPGRIINSAMAARQRAMELRIQYKMRAKKR